MNDLSNMLNRIKLIKKNAGLTNNALSKLTGIPKSTIDKFLSGIIKDPSIGTVIKISKALDVSADYLIGLIDTPEKPHPERISLSKDEDELLGDYRQLNTDGKDKSREYTADLTTIEKYTSSDPELKSKSS